MNIEDIPSLYRNEYSEECPLCTMTCTVLTQPAPGEYDTKIYVQCQCGEYLEFELPVN